jgi:hypothetical protein
MWRVNSGIPERSGKMMKKHSVSEKGQAIVFLVLGLVVFLGFVALAIDGGMVLADRRRAQNGSDASSLSGGGSAALSIENNANDYPSVTYTGWDCSSVKVQEAGVEAISSAIARAASNNFTINTNPADGNYVTAVCGVDDNGSFVDKFIDVTTYISSTTETSFIQVLAPTTLRNNVDAVTRVRPPTPFAYGNAIVALRDDCPNSNTGGVHFDGNAEVIIDGGGIFSNACFVASGNVDVSVIPNGTPNTCIGDDCYEQNGGASVDPVPNEGGPPLLPGSYHVPAPNCSALPDHGIHTGGGTIQPGRYDRITLNNGELNLQSGLYCIMNDDFRITGGDLIGSDVTIYIVQGDFDSAGSAHIVLDAPPAENCGEPCDPYEAIPGVLIYLAVGNTGEVSLLGDSGSDYMGLVYAPDGMIEAGGAGSLIAKIHAQLIGDTVFVHGNTTIDIKYENDEQKWKPARIELYK